MNTSVPAPSATADIDLDDIQDLPSAEIELTHPKTGKGLGAFVTLAGPEHPDRKRMSMAMIRRMRTEAARAEAANAMAIRTGKQPAVNVSDPEEDSAEVIENLAAITLSWRGMKFGGQELVCSKQAALDLYRDPKRQWIVRQLVASMNAVDVFTKA